MHEAALPQFFGQRNTFNMRNIRQSNFYLRDVEHAVQSGKGEDAHEQVSG